MSRALWLRGRCLPRSPSWPDGGRPDGTARRDWETVVPFSGLPPAVRRGGNAALAAAKCGRQPEITAFSNFPSRPARAGQHSEECALERCDLQWPPGDVWRLPGGARPGGGAGTACRAARPGRTGAVTMGRQGKNLNYAGIHAFIAFAQRRGIAPLAAGGLPPASRRRFARRSKAWRKPLCSRLSFPPCKGGPALGRVRVERCDLRRRFDSARAL